MLAQSIRRMEARGLRRDGPLRSGLSQPSELLPTELLQISVDATGQLCHVRIIFVGNSLVVDRVFG